MKLVFRNKEKIRTEHAFNTIEIYMCKCEQPYMLWTSDIERNEKTGFVQRSTCKTIRYHELYYTQCIDCLSEAAELLYTPIKLKDIQVKIGEGLPCSLD